MRYNNLLTDMSARKPKSSICPEMNYVIINHTKSFEYWEKSTPGVAHDASIVPGKAGSTVAKASGTVITVGDTIVVVDIRMALSQHKNTRSLAFMRGFLSGHHLRKHGQMVLEHHATLIPKCHGTFLPCRQDAL